MAQRKIPKRIVNAVRQYRRRLERNAIPIDSVLVYGSYAKRTAHKWSDIDVCVISPAFTDPFDAMALLLKQRSRDDVLAGIEPIGFTPRDFRRGSTLVDEIKRTGVPVR